MKPKEIMKSISASLEGSVKSTSDAIKKIHPLWIIKQPLQNK